MRFLLPAVVFVAALAMRWPILAAHHDTWYPFETHAGTIAAALLDRVDVDVATLPIVPHIRGGVLFGLLLAPLFHLLGPTSLALKVLPWLWHAATLALLAALLRRYFTGATAIVGAVLFLTAPPMMQKLSVLGLGSHMESSLLLLLALIPFYRMTVDRRVTVGNGLAFGLAIGVAGFFHLQALLPALLLAGLLLLSLGPAVGWRPVVAAVAGAAVAAAPSWLFVDGNLALLSISLGKKRAAPSQAGPGPGEKLADLVSGDFASALEFGEAGAAGAALGVVFSVALVAAAMVALAGARDELRGLIGRLRRPRRADPVPLRTTPFVLHAILVTLLFLVSHAQNKSVLSAGAANRHLAPLYTSLLILAAIGIGESLARGRRAAPVILLLALLVPGVVGYASTARSAPANRVLQRGECYEFLSTQLRHHTDGDLERTVALITRVDRGEAAFRTFRFRIGASRGRVDDEAIAAIADLPDDATGRIAAAFEATWVGRRLVLDHRAENGKPSPLKGRPGELIPLITSPWFSQAFGALTELRQTALLHGVGLALEAPRAAKVPAQNKHFMESLERLRFETPARFHVPILEGYGFAFGLVYDPYNGFLVDQMRRFGNLPARVQEAVLRGVGWGYRQRYATAPTEVPDGLAVVDLLRARSRPVFEAAFLGRSLPIEAALWLPPR